MWNDMMVIIHILHLKWKIEKRNNLKGPKEDGQIRLRSPFMNTLVLLNITLFSIANITKLGWNYWTEDTLGNQ